MLRDSCVCYDCITEISYGDRALINTTHVVTWSQSGKPHMGHAALAALQDIVGNSKRAMMSCSVCAYAEPAACKGERHLCCGCVGHGGIATQTFVQRQLAAEGISRQVLGRDAVEERVYVGGGRRRRVTMGQMQDQLWRLGASCD